MVEPGRWDRPLRRQEIRPSSNQRSMAKTTRTRRITASCPPSKGPRPASFAAINPEGMGYVSPDSGYGKVAEVQFFGR